MTSAAHTARIPCTSSVCHYVMQMITSIYFEYDYANGPAISRTRGDNCTAALCMNFFFQK